ncbi:hypothetical protein DSD19_07225 [Rhodovulum sp. BSW8]|uniref:hypothetical protein n=1 Tax=Rhodovulum sp. BSW8 TaxID=2259645 RepID=UPI000DE4C2AF|nr:hypothetical protein [Rhodovulum sp. BSW8]RBO53894.1 hypothetical protein DSD19_07225 [Rhodovulum sp. BSW8]
MNDKTDTNESADKMAANSWQFWGPGQQPGAPYGQGGAWAGRPPCGWYYFGPEAPVGPGPQQRSGGADTADYIEAFEHLSRGDVNPAALGKLLALNDRDFWKGALIGAGAVLALSNLPALKALLGTFAAAASSEPPSNKAKEPDQ